MRRLGNGFRIAASQLMVPGPQSGLGSMHCEGGISGYCIAPTNPLSLEIRQPPKTNQSYSSLLQT